MSVGSSETTTQQAQASDLPRSSHTKIGDMQGNPTSPDENGQQGQAIANQPEASALNGAVLPKIIPFETLARCGEEIWIENNGQIYRLRRTKQGKLILTK